MASDLGPVLKAAYPKVVATLVRVLGDMDRAMDATQDALVKALKVWQQDGVPANPVAWLVTVGRNQAIDQLRRETRSVSLDSNVVPLIVEPAAEPAEIGELDWAEVDDDLLRLMFTCCHPALKPPAQITLMLKVVLGFSVEEIARGLLATPASVEKRITRAKQRLRDAAATYDVPRSQELPERLDAVLKAIYLLFNEGYTRIQDASLTHSSLIDVAIRLGRMTCRLCRHDAQPRALLALMLLSASRLPGRLDAGGMFVPLAEQDRGRWDKAMIREGVALIDAVCVGRHRPGAYQIQAAISALHCQAASAEDTDWPQIVALYETLKGYDASPVVPVNQAVAHCYCGEADEALAQLEAPELASTLQDYQPYQVALAFACERAGQTQRAICALERAIELAPSPAQRRYLTQRLDALQA